VSTITRTESMSEIIANPLFKRGYEHGWSGEEPTSDRGWMPHEQEAYERGRMFADWLIGEGEGKVPLTRGYLAHPRAEALLLRALHSQNVL
jgi:hypothetical protein